MTFLSPMSGLLAAAVAVPALLLLYLLRLRRRPLRVSSTLLWEQAAKDLQVNVPLRMLRWSWLLLLHGLALGCFLLALARPAIGEGGPAASRIVIVIDRSASMSAVDAAASTAGGPAVSRLDSAKRRARELIESIGRAGAGSQRPRCMIIEMAVAPRSLTAFTPDLSILREAVDSISPTDQQENLAETLRLIEAVTADATEDETGSTGAVVYLITDGVVEPPTRLQHRGLRIVPLLIPENGRPASEESVENIGIVAVNARFDVEDSTLIRIFARVVNAGRDPVDIALRCTVDGQTPSDGITSITVPAATQVDGEMRPGEAAATFAVRPAPSPAARLVLVSITRPDALASDDAAGVVLPPPWKPRVLIVAPDAQSPDAAPAPDVFLLQAVDAIEPASLSIVPVSTFQPQETPPGAVTPPLPWSNADIVIFDRVSPSPASLPPVPSISFGASLPIDGLEIRATDGSATRAIAWKRDHPALRYVGLDPLLVAPAVWIDLQGDLEAGRSFETLADGVSGPLIAEIGERRPTGGTLSRLIVAFDLSRSNWGPDISFPLFIGNAIEHLSTSAGSAAAFPLAVSTVDRLSVAVLPGASSLVAEGGTSIKFDLPGEPAAARQLQVGPIERVGVYTLKTDDGRPVVPAAAIVNLASERESSLARRLGTLPQAATDAADGGQSGPTEIWHWFILAALALLTIEWFVYAWQMRS